jgi:hypothetical protein
MSKLIGILILVAGFWGFFKLMGLYNKTKIESEGPAKVQQAAAPADALPPLPPALEASLAQAKAGGADAMKDWLAANQPYLRDPRKAAIELDYARLLVRSDPAGAKRIYQAVKARTPADSPVAEQLKSLGRLFE